MRIKEESLARALQNAHLKELPKQYKGKDKDDNFWIEAIILVRKRNLDESYAIARRNGHGMLNIILDCGRMSPVMGVMNIYPYLYLEDYGVFSVPEKERIKATEQLYMPSCPVDKRLLRETKGEELNCVIRDILIDRQLRNLEEDVRKNALDEREVSTDFRADGSEDLDNSGKEMKDRKRSKVIGQYGRIAKASEFLFGTTGDKELPTL